MKKIKSLRLYSDNVEIINENKVIDEKNEILHKEL